MIYEKVKETGKHGLVFGLGGMTTRVIGFFLIPLYTRLLTPSDFGTMELVSVLLAFVLPFLSGGMDIAIFRFYYETESDDDYQRLVGTMFTGTLFISALLANVLICFRSEISTLLFGEATYSGYLLWAFIAGFFNAISRVPRALFRAQKKSTRYAVYNVLTLAVGITLNLLFLVRFEWGVLGVFRAQAISAAISCLTLLIDRRKDIALTFSFSEFARLFRFGIPFVPESILYILMTMSDRYIIRRFGGLSELGSYALGFRIASITTLLFYGPIGLIQDPIIFEVMNRPGAERLYSKLLTYFFGGGVALSLCLSLLSPELLKIMATPAFLGASSVIPLLCLGHIFYGCRVMAGVGLVIKSRTYYFPLIIGIAAISSIAMNLALIPTIGIIGAGLAYAVANGIEPMLRYVIARKHYDFRPEWSRLVGIFAVAVVITLISRSFEIENLPISILWKVSLLVTFLAALNLFGIIDSNERKASLRLIGEAKAGLTGLYANLPWRAGAT